MFSTKVGFSVVYVDAPIYLLKDDDATHEAYLIRKGMENYPCHRRSLFDGLDRLISRRSGTYFPKLQPSYAEGSTNVDRMKAFGDTIRRLALTWCVQKKL
jgi:hypothetical protein